MHKIKKGSAIYFYLLFRLLGIPFQSTRMTRHMAKKQKLVNEAEKITEYGMVACVASLLDMPPVWLFIIKDQEEAAQRFAAALPGKPFAPAKLSIPMSCGMSEKSARSVYSRMIAAGMLNRVGKGLVSITETGRAAYNILASCTGMYPPSIQVCIKEFRKNA